MLPEYFQPGLYRFEYDANTGYIKDIVRVKWGRSFNKQFLP
jgi:hypothetical protein